MCFYLYWWKLMPGIESKKERNGNNLMKLNMRVKPVCWFVAFLCTTKKGERNGSAVSTMRINTFKSHIHHGLTYTSKFTVPIGCTMTSSHWYLHSPWMCPIYFKSCWNWQLALLFVVTDATVELHVVWRYNSFCLSWISHQLHFPVSSSLRWWGAGSSHHQELIVQASGKLLLRFGTKHPNMW